MIPAADLFSTYRQAQTLIAAGELRQAADLCKEMLDSDPAYPYGYHLMSSLFSATGTFAKALSFSQMAVKIAPDVADFHIQQGQVLLAVNAWETAADSFEKAAFLEPENPWPVLLRADACARQGRFDEATVLFRRARIIRDIPEIDEHHGLSLLLKGEIVAAEKLFDRFIARCPDQYWGHICKGKVLFMQQCYPQAEACFSRALKLHPLAYEALHYMALVNERQGLNDIALRYAMQAVQAEPKECESHMLLGTLLMQENLFEAAEQILRQAYSFKPDQVYILHLLIQVLRRQNKLAEALELADNVLLMRPDNSAMRHVRALLKGEQLVIPPEKYISGLFDGWARRFEYDQQVRMSYKAPMQIADALRALKPEKNLSHCSLLDLGCGTGLVAKALHEHTGLRIGVDLSPRMLEEARIKQLYAELYTIDATEFLGGSDRNFDLVVAADMLPYMGDLSPFFRAVRCAMSAGGVFAFTIEKETGVPGFRLHSDGRYTHTPDYILRLAREEGFKVLSQDEIVLRLEHYIPIQGMLFLLGKTSIH